MARKTKGRRKVEMKKMENEANLQVTFSKRRNGLFKKANELSTMCGAEAAIIVFSPGGKVFSFGHPSVEEVAVRFLTGQVRHRTGTSQLVEAYRSRTVRGMNQELTMVTDHLELEKKRGEELRRRVIASRAEYGLDKPVEELDDMAQLERLKASLEQLQINVANKAENQLVAHQNAEVLVAAASQFQLGTGNTSAFGQVGGSGNNVGFIGGPENNIVGFTGGPYDNIGYTGGSENINVGFTGSPENNAPGFTGDGFMPFNAWCPGYGGPGYGGPF